MIEKIILDYLDTVLPCPAYMEQPPNPPAKFALVEKTGGGDRNHIASATLAIQSYGTTMYDAAQLNERVKEAMNDAVQLNSVCSIKLNSDYNFTDTTTKRYRYQAVYDMTYYK